MALDKLSSCYIIIIEIILINLTLQLFMVVFLTVKEEWEIS